MNLMFRGIDKNIQSVDRKIKRLGDAFPNYQEFFQRVPDNRGRA